MKSFLRLPISIVVFLLVGAGLSVLFLPLLGGIVWSAAHGANSQVVIIGLSAVCLLVPLSGAIFVAKLVYARFSTSQDLSRRPTTGKKVFSSLLCLLALLGGVGYFRYRMAMPKVEPLQQDLIIVKDQYMPTNPVLINGDIYWQNNSGGGGSAAIMAASTTGDNLRQICRVNAYNNDIFSDGESIYWVENYTLMKFHLPAGPATKLAEASEVSGMAFDQESAYWVKGLNNYAPAPNLFRVLKQGGKAEGLLPGLQYDFSSETPQDLALDSGYLYWTDSAGGSVFRLATRNGSREILAKKQTYPHSIVTDEKYVYWTSLGTLGDRGFNKDGALLRVPKSGGEFTVLLSDLDEPSSLTADSLNLYMSCRSQIVRISKQGGPATVLAEGQLNIRGIQVNDQFVFWTDERGGVYRVSK